MIVTFSRRQIDEMIAEAVARIRLDEAAIRRQVWAEAVAALRDAPVDPESIMPLWADRAADYLAAHTPDEPRTDESRVPVVQPSQSRP